MFKCPKCQDKGYYGTNAADFETCDCPIGIQLQSDLEKADEKYHAQTCDVEEGTAQ